MYSDVAAIIALISESVSPTLQQLVNHHCLAYSTERYSQQWPFHIDTKFHRIAVKPRMSANSNIILLNAALNGIGVARLPDYVVSHSLENNYLQCLLRDYYPDPIPIYAIYPQSRIIPPKVQAFVRFLEKLHVLKLPTLFWMSG